MIIFLILDYYYYYTLLYFIFYYYFITNVFYSLALQMCLHVSLISLAHYNFMFCITHAMLCDTATLYQGQVLMGG